MHDIDRTQLEFDEYEDQENDFEFDGREFGETSDMEADSPFSEVEEMELASELLAVSDEAELDQFLGKLMKRAGKFMKSPVGRALGGVLRNAARQALPLAGKAAGGFFGGPVGAALGGQLASTAGRTFGLELEGLSAEDAEFEVARNFVRFAGAAAANAAKAPASVSPSNAAQSAVAAAAQSHAPGLLRPSLNGVRGGRSGRWIRRGRKIVLLGV
jgi:hypothetical protein